MKPVKKRWKLFPPIVIIKYWIIQGMLFMNNVERFHRLLLETILFIVLIYFLGVEKNNLIYAFVLSHTASFFLNGHLFAMLAHDLFWIQLYQDKSKFIDYVNKMKKRIYKKDPQYIENILFYGSLSRGIFRKTSDLDIRFIAKKGIVNQFKTAHFVFLERLYALFSGFPLDAYMFCSDKEAMIKMDVENETPVCLYSSIDQSQLKNNQIQSYDIFKKNFYNFGDCI